MAEEKQAKLTPDDFKSDQEVRWCAGCGDNAVLAAIQRTLPELGIPRERFTFISGIGCSSRFPYYMNTYGLHGIHGRAAAIASGVKVANLQLSVWEITGDGDSMAIGGNHFIHYIRRNVDFNCILLNNQIYGLTKGQYSPTSKYGQITKTSPFGTIENAFNPGRLTIGAKGKFFARVADNNIKMLKEVFKEAAGHRGASVVEVLQNCVIYNDKAHSAITDKNVRDDRQLILKHGEPMIFGKNKDKGLILERYQLKVVTIGETIDGKKITKDDILVHDAHSKSSAVHLLLVNMEPPEFPVAIGVIRNVQEPTYSDKIVEQIEEIKRNSDIKCVDDLLNSGNTWEIKENE